MKRGLKKEPWRIEQNIPQFQRTWKVTGKRKLEEGGPPAYDFKPKKGGNG